MQIAAVENAMIAKVMEVLPAPILKQVDSLPADFDEETLRRVLRLAPAAFIVFDGGQATSGSSVPGIIGNFSAIAVASHASGEKARRLGDQTAIGAYQILETLIPILHRLNVPNVGSLTLASVENRFDGQIDKQGLAVYAALFTIPLSFDPVPFESLNPFLNANVTTSKPSIDPDEPAAVDSIDLPQ